MSNLPSDITNLVPIRENQRFATYRATYKDQQVFVKQVRHADLAQSIQAELWGIGAFTELASHNELPFKVPQVLLSGTDFLVTSWAEGETLKFNPDSPDFDGEVEFFATSLATVDILTRSASPKESKFSAHDANQPSFIQRRKDRMGQVPYQRYFDQALIDDAFAMLAAKLPLPQARLTHADFTPGNILRSPTGMTLVDFESTSPAWPRFYDLVNMSFNYMVLHPATTLGCQKMVQLYGQHNPDATTAASIEQMNTIAMVRALSVITELLSAPNASHNTQQDMTPELAEGLGAYMKGILGGVAYFEVKI